MLVSCKAKLAFLKFKNTSTRGQVFETRPHLYPQ